MDQKQPAWPHRLKVGVSGSVPQTLNSCPAFLLGYMAGSTAVALPQCWQLGALCSFAPAWQRSMVPQGAILVCPTMGTCPSHGGCCVCWSISGLQLDSDARRCLLCTPGSASHPRVHLRPSIHLRLSVAPYTYRPCSAPPLLPSQCLTQLRKTKEDSVSLTQRIQRKCGGIHAYPMTSPKPKKQDAAFLMVRAKGTSAQLGVHRVHTSAVCLPPSRPAPNTQDRYPYKPRQVPTWPPGV